MNKERDYFFDNLKAVLIFLVVLGHFLLPIHGESVLVVVKRLIYVFPVSYTHLTLPTNREV